METIFNYATKTGEIVTRLPEASTILKKYRIDFCCGGNKPIGEVITEKQLNGEEVMEELNLLYTNSLEKPTKNMQELSSNELIRYIVNNHHAYLNTLLPELSQITTKILRVHGSDRPELTLVHKLFHQLKTELEQHTIDEENNVFPKITAFENDPSEQNVMNLENHVDELIDEHEEAGNLLEQLRKVTNDFTPPEWACMTYQLTYQKLADLESDLFEHIHLENNILFPRVIKKVQELH